MGGGARSLRNGAVLMLKGFSPRFLARPTLVSRGTAEPQLQRFVRVFG
jgi:hypothetical protein